MNNENKIIKYIYEMKKDVAVIKEHIVHLNGTVKDTKKQGEDNRDKIQKTNLRMSKLGGIGLGILIGLQILQGAILLFINFK